MRNTKDTMEKEICKYYIHHEEKVQQEYKEIVENYIKYYHLRAEKSKRTHYVINCIKIIALASVPGLQLIPSVIERPWITAFVSAIGLVAETMLALFKSKEKWQLYRDANNMLIAEQRKYYCDVDEYSGEDNSIKKWKCYVQNVESIVDGEARKWSMKMVGKNEEQEKAKNNFE